MLRSLRIRNFAIIDEVDIDLAAGMTVLTGETGAGKSILVDALSLILGERGGSGLVREDAKRAEFSAEFDLTGHPTALEWLKDQAVDADDPLPDFTESLPTVSRGRLQIEMGYTFARDRGVTTHSIGEALLRIDVTQHQMHSVMLALKSAYKR